MMDKKNECTNPHEFMMAVSVDTAMRFQMLVHKKMEEYKSKGIDVIPISELEHCGGEAVAKSLSSEGLLANIMKGK